jgi:hypothetical protein
VGLGRLFIIADEADCVLCHTPLTSVVCWRHKFCGPCMCCIHDGTSFVVPCICCIHTVHPSGEITLGYEPKTKADPKLGGPTKESCAKNPHHWNLLEPTMMFICHPTIYKATQTAMDVKTKYQLHPKLLRPLKSFQSVGITVHCIFYCVVYWIWETDWLLPLKPANGWWSVLCEPHHDVCVSFITPIYFNISF